MVPTGDNAGNWLQHPAARRFLIAFGTLGLIGTVLAASNWVLDIHRERGQIETRAEARCGQSHDCSDKDLKQQVRTADAAEFMADLVVWQLVFSVIGVAFVGRALVYTASSARAATEANLLALKISVEERRPWIVIGVSKANVVTGEDGTDYVTLQFVLRNVGHHPATGIVVSGEEFRSEGGVTWLSTPGQMISEARAIGVTHAIGYSLFPGEDLPHGQVFSIRRKRLSTGGLIGGYVQYNFGMSQEAHFTPWAFEIRYQKATPGTEATAAAEKFYVTTSPT